MEPDKGRLDPRLAHLTSEQIADVVVLYNDRTNTVSAIMEAFGINGRPSELLSMLPPRVHADLTCPWCPDQNLVSRHKSRDSLAREPIPHCPSCGHLHQH